jgi:hypothetical protein
MELGICYNAADHFASNPSDRIEAGCSQSCLTF